MPRLSIHTHDSPTAFYDHPCWYDIVHAKGTAAEIDFLESIVHQYCRTPRARAVVRAIRRGTGVGVLPIEIAPSLHWLEPACGTSRHLAVLTRRHPTHLLCGYDTNPHMLDYARRRMSRTGHQHVHVANADMTTFRADCNRPRLPKFDIAFNTINTFRHLLDPGQALAHLTNTAASLARGGIYVLGTDRVRTRSYEPRA